MRNDTNPTPPPPKISDGQWRPQKILKNPTKELAIKNIMPSNISYGNKERERAKNTEVCAEGNDG